MKYHGMFITLILVATALSTCGQPTIPVKIVQEVVYLSQSQVIILEIESGQVTIIGGRSDGTMQINGQLMDPQRVAFFVKSSNEQVEVTTPVQRRPFSGFSSPPVVLAVEVPDGYSVHVKSFDAAVTVRDFRGDLQISSVSGDLLAENVAGTIALVSGRGDITIKNATGQLRVLGEHGVLNLENVSGIIGSSTIMGTIRYLSRPMPGDTIRIEVDHGPVEIFLPSDSNLDVEIRSTSGELVCMVPGLRSTGPSCLGTVGSGGASMTVRTVSGRVTLQVSPLIP